MAVCHHISTGVYHRNNPRLLLHSPLPEMSNKMTFSEFWCFARSSFWLDSYTLRWLLIQHWRNDTETPELLEKSVPTKLWVPRHLTWSDQGSNPDSALTGRRVTVRTTARPWHTRPQPPGRRQSFEAWTPQRTAVLFLPKLSEADIFPKATAKLTPIGCLVTSTYCHFLFCELLHSGTSANEDNSFRNHIR